MDATLVVAIAFGLFLVLSYKPLGRFLSKGLDARSQRIEEELSEAIRLREEAQVRLSEYERKYQDIEKEAEDILNNARTSAQAMQQEASDALHKTIEAKLVATNLKIQRAEELALQDIQQQIVDLALKASENVIADHAKNKAHSKLISLAKKDMAKVLH